MNDFPQLRSDSPFDRELLEAVHPSDWINPTPDDRYNLVVVGAGSGGLVTAAGAAGVGARVALVEESLMGGDCLNVGCVPSKALIRSAHAAHDVHGAGRFGVRVPSGAEVDFPAVMERMREIRQRISPLDSARRFRDELGVDIYLGRGRFTGIDTLEVDGRTLRFKKAVIATGGRPVVPEIPGLAEAGFLTNETIFALDTLPRRLLVLGGGPIGCELAQAFQRFGSQVTLVEKGAQFLPREDPDAAQLLSESLQRDGVTIRLNTQVSGVEVSGNERHIHFGDHSLEPGKRLVVDAILVGAGRIPNVEDLGLETANVDYDTSGVRIDDHFRSSNKRIFAVGDVSMSTRFTHAADFAARAVVRNALFFGREKKSALNIPWCTYTDPEIAHVGLYERDAAVRGIETETFERLFSDVDRAIAEGDEEGFVKIHVKRGSDEILGATIAGRRAGDMISEISVAMAGKVGLGRLASVIHPYPTQADAIRQCGDAFNRTRLTPRVKSLFERYLRFSR